MAVEKEKRAGDIKVMSVQSELNQRIAYFREENMKLDQINARLLVRARYLFPATTACPF